MVPRTGQREQLSDAILEQSVMARGSQKPMGAKWTGQLADIAQALSRRFVHRNGSTMTGGLTVSTSDGNERYFQLVYSANDQWSGYLRSDKIRGTSVVQDGDLTLHLVGRGYDGDEYHTNANIRFTVDGTPGNNDMPGSIDFYTTPDGSTTPALRCRIRQDGSTQLGDGGSTNYAQFASNGDQSFAGSAGLYPRTVSQDAEPAAGTGATQIDSGEMIVWVDTNDSDRTYMMYNRGGTVVKIELT